MGVHRGAMLQEEVMKDKIGPEGLRKAQREVTDDIMSLYGLAKPASPPPVFPNQHGRR